MQDKQNEQQEQATQAPIEDDVRAADQHSRKEPAGVGGDEKPDEDAGGAGAEVDARLRGHDERSEAHVDAPDDLQILVTKLQAQLAEANEALAKSERQRLLDRALIEAGAVDVDAAQLLLERMRDIEGEPAEVVAELKQRKAYLFRQEAPAAGAPTMGARRTAGRAPVLDAAYSAMSTGKRAELLQYMRMKRNGRRAAIA